jgi:hypothetical protein
VLGPLRFTVELPRVRWCVVFTLTCALAAFLQGSAAAVDAVDHTEKLEREATFHIESGSLESALIQFSRQSGIQVVLSTRVTDISVLAIDGRRNVREVLKTLLSTTGLTFDIVGETVTVYAVATKVHPTVASPIDDPSKNAPETGHRR